MATPIGTRVELILEVDNFPIIRCLPGTRGTLTRIDEMGFYWIRLDVYHHDLDEWDNQLMIADMVKNDPERFFKVIQ